MPYLQELVSEANEGIRVHHASGHFTRDEALARLSANGMSEADAGTLLDQPVDPALFDYWKTWAKPRQTEVCPACGGDGELECEPCEGVGDIGGVICDECIGVGRIECEGCEGEG